jgi:hypothetical protein
MQQAKKTDLTMTSRRGPLRLNERLGQCVGLFDHLYSLMCESTGENHYTNLGDAGRHGITGRTPVVEPFFQSIRCVATPSYR